VLDNNESASALVVFLSVVCVLLAIFLRCFLAGCKSENLETGKVHPLFKINCHSAIDTAKLPIKLKLLTGTYILQSKRIRMYKNEIDPKCLLCAKEEENRSS
jgi:hypothetical protein